MNALDNAPPGVRIEMLNDPPFEIEEPDNYGVILWLVLAVCAFAVALAVYLHPRPSALLREAPVPILGLGLSWVCWRLWVNWKRWRGI